MITTDWYVTQINQVDGQLFADLPVLIRPTDYPEGWGAPPRFSPTGDRLVYFDGYSIIVADLVRHPDGRITGVTNRTVVIGKDDIGSPADTNAAGATAFHGHPDFSPDGSKLVVVSYSDLWMIDLGADGHSFAGKRPLTRTYGVSEILPVFAPDGSRVAYVGATNEYFTGFGWAMPTGKNQIYTVDVASGVVVSVLNRKTRGQSSGYGSNPTWSPDSMQLVFSGPGATAGRNAPCRSLTNYDLFRIPSDGSSGAVYLTNTVGTASEGNPRWGW
jgi:Tol biopolymer transport system component